MNKLFAFAFVFISLVLSPFASAEQYSISAQETYKMVQNKQQKMLFIDVRDPLEIQFTGYTDAIDINIPLLFADPKQWNPRHQSFAMTLNENFIADVEKALAERGLDKDTLIITMCRSGSGRGLPSVQILREHGFNNSLYVEHGFQGDVIRTGQHQGMRLINGWQNSGLPWSYSLSSSKIYKR